MKRYIYLMAILLISSMMARADETITVSATNSDIAANLDLKVVAKLFGEAKDLEDFEQRLNNPDSAFVNLDLNGDGDVDYIRVIEVSTGSKHLIVLQAVLAKDIYQDIASIYVEKDEANNVSVQIIGDEYVYGENYVIEPVYIYRPVIYDWFWGPYWVCWSSPWYWGYYPYWWHTWHCWAYWDWVDHCHHFHHHHHGCSFHYAQTARPSSRSMGQDVRRSDYAKANPDRSFTNRNQGMTNARQLSVGSRSSQDARSARTTIIGSSSVRQPAVTVSDRTYGGTYTKASDKGSTSTSRPAGSVTTTRPSGTATTTTTTRSGSSSTVRPSGSTSRPTGTTYTGSGNSRSGASGTSTSTYSRTGSSTSSSSSSSSSSSTRSSSSSTYRPAGSSSSSVGTFHPSSGSSSPRPSGGASGGSAPRGGGGGASPRR